MKELITIQQQLNAPKNLRNNFWNYNYRSAESILEAVKPILKKENCILLLTDELVNIWERYYIKAKAVLKKEDGSIIEEAIWYAREEESKKWMDGSQVTWASSSYARKYALNGLFLIDDTKDSDATNTHDKESKKETKVDKENEVEKNWLNIKTDNDLEVLRNKMLEKWMNAQEFLTEMRKHYKISRENAEKISNLF